MNYLKNYKSDEAGDSNADRDAQERGVWLQAQILDT